MGTNYYLMHKEPVCKCCGHKKEPLHIGKSSGGWCFSLHVEPSDPVFPHNLEEWKYLFNSPCHYIEDEYSNTISKEEMLKTITKRFWLAEPRRSENEYNINQAESRPKNLVRCKVDDVHYINHGDSTYDLIQGEFS